MAFFCPSRCASFIEDALVTREPELVRNLSVISDMIKESGLPPLVKERSVQVFTALGEAEAKTHGSTLDQVCSASFDQTWALHLSHLIGIRQDVVDQFCHCPSMTM